MSKEKSQKQFTDAKQLFSEGRYEEALSQLSGLSAQYPGVFNIEYPILQCLQRLGRVAEVRELHDRIRGMYTKEGQQAKLHGIEGWIVAEESKINAGGDLPVVQFDILDDILDKPKPKKVAAPPPKSFSLSFSLKNKYMIAAAVILVLLVGGYFGAGTVIQLLFAPPEFSADLALILPYDTFNGKIYFRNTRNLRTELLGNTFLFKDGQRYALRHDSQSYAVLRVAAGPNPLEGMANISLRNLKKVGQETLRGYDCTIYESAAGTRADAPQSTSRIWYAKDIRLPIQIESSVPLIGKIVTSLQNINIGPMNDSLFEIPGNYTKSSDSPTMMELIMNAQTASTPAAIPSTTSPPIPDAGLPSNVGATGNPDLQNIMRQLQQQ